MLTAQEAKSLGGIARQVRALLLGIDKLPEAFEAVEGLEVQLATAKREKLMVEADVVAVRAAFVKLDGDYRTLQKQYEELNQKHLTRKQALEDTLQTLLADVTAAQQLKQETDEQLAALTAKLTR